MTQVNRKLWPWVMFAGILALYLLLPTKNYFWDGVDFAQHIEDAPGLDTSLIHPNHLFYNAFGYIAYRVARALASGLRAIEALQIANSILSVFAALLFFRILNRALGSTYFSYVLTLLLAFSATWWKYSTDADSYIPSCLFLISSLYFLLPDRKPRPLVVALLHSAAMMFHQMAVFFYPVAAVGILLQTRGQAGRRRLLLVLEYSAAAFLLTILTFYTSFHLQTGRSDFYTFFKWMTSLSPQPGHTFSVWGNLSYTVGGHIKLFTSGRLLYLQNSLNVITALLVAALVATTVALAVKLVRSFRELKSFLATLRQKDDRFGPLRVLCAVWIAAFLVFQYFFVPQHTFYRLFYLPALLLLAGTYLVQYDLKRASVRKYRAALLVAAIALSNLTFYIMPLSRVENFPPLAMALKLNEAWPKGTIVYFASRNSDNSLARYFNPSATWVETDPARLEGELRAIRGGAGPVWMETSLIERFEATPEGRRWIEQHTVRPPQYQLVNSKYRLQFYQINPDTF